MIIGIDLGTTNSLVAYFEDGQSKIIPNRLGEKLTPSVVCVDDEGRVSVGKTAREYGYLHPNCVASVFKRTMGTNQKYKLNGFEYTAKDLSSFVLRSLKEDAEVFLGEEITEAVISVPAYFDEARRKATKQAGELAGLKVERIISEPTAAAVAYGLYENEGNKRFLVFDLGGGTFDVSILELFENILEVRAVAGDNYLGGEDFTKVIVDDFLDNNKLSLDNFTEKEYLALKRNAEEAKRAFSDKNKIELDYVYRGENYHYVLAGGDYEAACEPLFDKIRKQVQRSLSDAHIKLSEIDEIVLVGGATKLSIVRNFITKLFKKFPNIAVNPDEAVALGAAIQAAMKARNEDLKEVILTDVCSFTLGTEVSVEKENGAYESGHFLPIIDRNTVIPASRTERLYTIHDNQERIVINILQGESRFAENNLKIGQLEITIPKNKAGEEAVDITYTYDVNSLLEVQVRVISTGEVKKQIVKGNDNDMTDEEIERRMKELAYLKVHPRDQEENRLLLLRCERLYEETTGQARTFIDTYTREFEDALNTQNRDTIEIARNKLKERLHQFDDWC